MPPPLSSPPELLAPAGDWDALRAAVANGADAVYFGLGNFNARHRATNFQNAELPEVVRYLHAHNVRAYLTFNTLIFADELPQAEEWIRAIATAAGCGGDAVIVQDLGLARLLARAAPSLEIHGSTQMTLTEPRGLRLVHELGIQRVILARELSITDIHKIVAALRALTPNPSALTPLLEVFVHGALCVAYSGQCLTSESLGGRSANRGQCAQACRLPYDLFVDGQQKDLGDKAYLLSPQDLAAHDRIADLVTAGVHAFKIEGRLKSAHYVAAATQVYRAALDAALARRPFVLSPQQKLDLEQSFSRGFTTGFLDGVNHQRLIHGRFPKAHGTQIGTVVAKSARAIIVRLLPQLSTQHSVLSTPLKPGDGVVFDEGHPEQDEQGGRVFAVRTPSAARPGEVEIELSRGDINLSAIATGALVWKTDDPAVRKRLEHSFARETVARRTAITATVVAAVGEKLRVTFTAGPHSATVESDAPLEKASKFAISREVVREQLARLGDTPFELGEVHLEAEGGPMVPKSVLNDLRRRAAAALEQQRWLRPVLLGDHALEQLRAEFQQTLAETPLPPHPLLHILVRTPGQLEALIAWKSQTPLADGLGLGLVYCDYEDPRRYKDAVAAARRAGLTMGLATVRILKPSEEGLLKIILDAEPDAVLVRNLAAIGYYHEAAPALPLIGDYALNIANDLTAAVFYEAGLRRMVPSYDLNFRQLQALLAALGPRGAGLLETVIHQHMPMFHMEHCVFAHTLSAGTDYRTCGRPCDRHQVDLRDRMGQRHPLVPDVGCRNTLFNATAQTAAAFVPEMLRLGLRHFRVELLRETPAEVPTLLDRYARVLAGQEEPRTAARRRRVLQQLGVTRGTGSVATPTAPQ